MLTNYQNRIDAYAIKVFENLLAKNNDVTEAIHYSFFNGGKKIRPALVYALSETLKKPLNLVDDVALSIECIHTYSLIHDDLPAMDNDDLRRGKPSCHKAFNESIAILAGDALNTLAFEILAKSECSDQNIQQQIVILAKNVGSKGMILGQAMDMQSSGDLTSNELKYLHNCKTGKLIQACFEMVINKNDNLDKNKLMQAAKLLGIIYQIQDDVLDVMQTTEVLGKPSQSDEKNSKVTYVSLLGIEKAIKEQQTLTKQMNDLFEQSLKNFDTKPLYLILDVLLNRNQ